MDIRSEKFEHLLQAEHRRKADTEKGVAKAVASPARDAVNSILILTAATLIGYVFYILDFTEANIITVYILAAQIISVVTSSPVYALPASVISVFVFNFFFTVPRFTFHVYDRGYPVTFAIMFLASFFTGTLASRLKDSMRQSANAAYRTEVLFEMNQLFQGCHDETEVLRTTADQLSKLLKRQVAVFPSEQGRLGEPSVSTDGGEGTGKFADGREKEAAGWVLEHNSRAGARTEQFGDAHGLYLPVCVREQVYGVVGVDQDAKPLDALEESILLSVSGECAMALENIKNAREKEEAAVLAQKEQLRANLLRAISHDLRTPLTSISGNASNLLSNYKKLDDVMREHIFADIYDDSMWLINLVENLLSVTRIEEGRMELNLSAQLVDDVIEEALRHVNRKKVEHIIEVETGDDLMLARMDGKLIVQVLINIVDNAIKYTPAGSRILITSKRNGEWAEISVADDGPGIPDEAKLRVFDMFYSGASKIADSRRSLGLGLSLCKSIVTAHGGTIRVTDNSPRGTVFTFTLIAEEVELHE